MSKHPDFKTFSEATVRIEHLIYLPSLACFDATPEVFDEEFCGYFPSRDDAPLYKSLPMLRKYRQSEDDPEPEYVAELLHGVPGFLFQASTPVMTPWEDGSGARSYSWGRYNTEWLYAAKADDIARVAAEWADTRRKAEDAKAKAAARTRSTEQEG